MGSVDGRGGWSFLFIFCTVLYLTARFTGANLVLIGKNVSVSFNDLEANFDGHCGFRVISESLRMGDNWQQVRVDLMNELGKRNILYDSIFGSKRKQDLFNTLDCKSTLAPYDKWMTIPDMGLVISSCYNICVVLISKSQSLTFLPLDAPRPDVPNIIWIGFINGNHFVGLCMKEGTPLPPLYSPWRRYHTQVGNSWECILNRTE